MKNKREIYQALLDGKTLGKNDTIVHLNDIGLLEDEGGKEVLICFHAHTEWEIIDKPVFYYRWKRKYSDSQTSWVKITSIYYPDNEHTKWIKEEGWTRIEPGKTFEEI